MTSEEGSIGLASLYHRTASHTVLEPSNDSEGEASRRPVAKAKLMAVPAVPSFIE